MNEDKQTLGATLVRLCDGALNLTHRMAATGNHLKEELSMSVNRQETYKPDNGADLKERILAHIDTIYADNYNYLVHGFTMTDQSEAIYDLNIPQNGFDLSEKAYSYGELKRIVDSFETDYRLPFEMCISGHSYTEIAQYMKLPTGTVKSRIFFVRKRLFEIMQKS